MSYFDLKIQFIIIFRAIICLSVFIYPNFASPQESQGQKQYREKFPQISGNIISRLGYNGDYESEEPLVEANDLFVQIIASPVFHLSEKIRFITETRIETIAPPAADRAFEDQGYFARILLAEYSVNDRFSIHAGKMTPSFALASFAIPGMYGNSYNKEIELIDQVGFGGAYTFGGEARGRHTLSFNTFFEDTSVFSESLGNNRGRTTLKDGGASNTESLESLALSLEGHNIDRFKGLTYKFGYVHRAEGSDGVADENGLSASFVQEYETARGDDWRLIGEIAGLQNFEGTADDIIYASAGVVYETGPWTAVLSGTYRPRFRDEAGNFEDYTIQTSIEYDLGKGFSLAVAHEFSRDQNSDNQRLGFRLSKLIDLGD